MAKKEVIAKMPKKVTIMRNLICPHCKLTNRVEVISGATIYIFCIHCETKMKWFEKIVDEETPGKIITLPPPKDEPEKPKESEIKWA